MKNYFPGNLPLLFLGVFFLIQSAFLRADDEVDAGCAGVDVAVECEPADAGADYSLTFDVVNNSGYDVTQLLVPDEVGGVGVTFSNGSNSLAVNLPDGDTLAGVTLLLSGGSAGDKFCIPIGLMAIDPENGRLFRCCGFEVCVDLPGCQPVGEKRFVRGDANSDNVISMVDGILSLNFLFLGAPGPACMDAADTDDTGSVDINDPVLIFIWLFNGGAPLAAPSPTSTGYPPADCGIDPGNDNLDCSQQSLTCA